MHVAFGPQSPAPSHTAHSSSSRHAAGSPLQTHAGARPPSSLRKKHKKKAEQKKRLPAVSRGNTTRQDGRKICAQCTHEAFKCRHKRKSARRGALSCCVEKSNGMMARGRIKAKPFCWPVWPSHMLRAAFSSAMGWDLAPWGFVQACVRIIKCRV